MRAPAILACAAVVILLLLGAFVPSNTTRGVNDTTNAGPSPQTVTPAPSRRHRLPRQTPNPATEPRKTP
jgi:hypothetical protein